MRKIIWMIGAVFSILFAGDALAVSDDDLVKISSSKICHPRESPYYDRVNDMRPNESVTLSACIANGGRLPQILQPLYYAQQAQKKAIAANDTTSFEAAQDAAAKASADLNKETEGFKDFGGLRFGLGIGMSFIGDQIDEVRIIDGRVAVRKERSNQERVILESHKFMVGLRNPEKGRLADNWAFGPFVAASLADDQGQGLLSAYGIGVMAGHRTEKTSRSWNIEVAWFVCHRASSRIHRWHGNHADG